MECKRMETILVVDDKANVREMLKDFLGEQGYRVVTAENGQDALYVSRYEKPNLVLLDLMMPKMDGFAFLPAFRRESGVPVILLTARIEESTKSSDWNLARTITSPSPLACANFWRASTPNSAVPGHRSTRPSSCMSVKSCWT